MYEEKREHLSGRLQEREKTRLADIERKKVDKENKFALNEKAAYFSDTFTKAKQQIEKKLSDTDSLNKDDLRDHFDDITRDFQLLQKILADSTMFLPLYNVKAAQDSLKNLQETIQEMQNIYLPKKKFVFKSKKKCNEKAKDCVDFPKEAQLRTIVMVKELDFGFRGYSNETLIKEPGEVTGKDIGLYSLKSCTVRIFGSPSTVHITDSNNCTILIGPVSTSVFIENCSNCNFVIACQQARIHSTFESNFYLHVTSKAIIEDCKDVGLAPYNWQYPNIDEHFAMANIDKNVNNWNDINDFNWLVANVQSPNWSVIAEEERVKTWI